MSRVPEKSSAYFNEKAKQYLESYGAENGLARLIAIASGHVTP